MAATAQEIERLKARLQLYYEKEEEMLKGGVKSYGLGSRNVERYDTDLKLIQSQIKELEIELKTKSAVKPRKAVGIVIRDI